jgi:general secretion pathway protein B
MSYILEALKKAQAERQLGSSPTLHAPTLQSAEQAASGGRLKAPMVLALLGMAAVIGVLLTLVLRTADPVAPAPVVVAPAPQAQLPHQPVAAPAPAPQPVLASQPTPLPAPIADLPPSVAKLAKASAPEAQTQTAVQAQAAAGAAPTSAPATAAVPATAPSKPATAPEEPVMNLRDLPEPIQRSVPQVTVGGYIYSKNPADRLLLVDKVLRHEGEEVAPGLTLEKLQPKEAVFNYKGYRYRVPY